ncbi:hypothetical protein S820908_164 [Synechococcus phage S-CAM9]|uniref:Uncharacterized protein n=1 Tax=Synechococcus phage S-CAM9 TaxID=1883369 RepID=A0A1D8KNS3_9CAUD|nr:hypothetical protein BOW85_gp084 [Synechococcus phage S-CAM9]AOV60311.1 hypothetical protein S050808_164 [Synechococcus phage S-CAM9]AOV60539.1 hypothetical protein S820908_164 [Synechococcus phage S-CAM9]AOV60768.1 hypothetical protein N161109_165 [Synechococcus phage S-CAM9]
MKTFQQFREESQARSAGAQVRQAINRATQATYDFGKGFVTGKAGTKPGSAQHQGSNIRKAGDRLANWTTQQALKNKKRDATMVGDFTKGVVTGKDK